MRKRISAWLLRLLGWRVEGFNPRQLDKYIIIVIPHTSNWDFPLGLLVRNAWELNEVKFLAKDSLFKPPLGWLFRWLGGYPVDRSKRHNYVDAVADIFDRHERFAITIAPEGTRSKVDRLRTGFYYIALKAKVPIIMAKFDFGNKVVTFSEPFWPTGDKEADFARIREFYKDAKGKNPELGIWYGAQEGEGGTDG